MEYLFLSVDALLQDFINPQKRIFVGYLLVAFIIAILVYGYRYRGKFRLKHLIRGLLSRRIWLSESSRADFKLLLCNRLIFGGVFTAFLSKSVVGLSIYFWVLESSGLQFGQLAQLHPFVQSIIFTVFLFVIDDYSRYWVHRWLHQFPILWEFHKVHHSATVLTPFTVFRTHPVEAVCFSFRGILVQGSVIGIGFALFGTGLSLATILGANAASVIFHSVGSNLRHSHVAFRYPKWLEYWLISPVQHQIHHSLDENHFDKNFGVAFACWDRIHGTLHFSDNKRLKFGLSKDEGDFPHKLSALISLPVKRSFFRLWSMFHHMLVRVQSLINLNKSEC